MANLGLVTLGSLRLQAQQKADLVNSGFLTTQEWNINLSNSYKELYDLLISAYGNEYYVAAPYAFTTNGTNYLYSLPDGVTTVDAITSQVASPFYKLIGLDRQINTNPVSNWETVRRFEFTERNKFWLLNPYSYYNANILRYKIVGNNIWITPIPIPNQTLQLWYIPQPINLQPTIVGGITSGSAVITTADTSQLSVGMTISSANLPSNATILSIVSNTSITISSASLVTAVGQIIYCWTDTTTVQGVSGWEEYIIVDAAIKAMIKEETDISGVMLQKENLLSRINQVAESRDASLPSRVSDTQSVDYTYWGNGWGGYGDIF